MLNRHGSILTIYIYKSKKIISKGKKVSEIKKCVLLIVMNWCRGGIGSRVILEVGIMVNLAMGQTHSEPKKMFFN